MTLTEILGSSRYPTIDLLLDDFHQAAATANLEKYFSCFTNNGTARFLGTDATENWTAEQFYSFCKPHFISGGGWTFIPKPGERKVTIFPPMPPTELLSTPYIPQFAVFDELLVSKSFIATSRGSGTVIFDPVHNCWFIAQYHLSFPIPNDIATEITKRVANFEKKQEELLRIQDKESAKLAAEEEAKRNEEEFLRELEEEKKLKKASGGGGGGGGGGKKNGKKKGK